MGAKRSIATLGVALAALLLPAASSAASWTATDPPPGAESGISGLAYGSGLVYDPAGNLWAETGQIGSVKLYARPRAGSFTQITNWQGGPIGFTSTGEAVTVSYSPTNAPIVATTRPVGSSSFGSPQTLGSGSGAMVSVVNSAAALAAWRDSSGNLQIAERAGGSFGAATEPASGVSVNSNVFVGPSIYPVLDPSGAAAILYSTSTGFSQVTRSSATGSFTSAPGFTTSLLPVGEAANRQGDAVVVFLDQSSPSTNVVEASYRPHGGSFGPLRVVATVPSVDGFPSTGVTGDGHAVMSFESTKASANTCLVVNVYRRSPGAAGGWSAAVSPFEAKDPSLSAGAADSYLLAWGKTPPCTGTTEQPSPISVSAAMGHAASLFTPGSATTLPNSAPPSGGGIAAVSAALDLSGNAFVVWRGADSLNNPFADAAVMETSGGGGGGGGGGGHGTGNLKKDLGVKATTTSDTVSTVAGAPVSLDCSAGCVAAVDGEATGAIVVSNKDIPPGGWPPPGPLSFFASNNGGGLFSSATKSKHHVKKKRHVVKLKIRTRTYKLAAGKRKTIIVPFGKRAQKIFTFILNHGGTVSTKLNLKSSLDPGRTVHLTVKFKHKKKKRHRHHK